MTAPAPVAVRMTGISKSFGGIKAIWNASDPSPIVARFVTLLVPTRTDEVA